MTWDGSWHPLPPTLGRLQTQKSGLEEETGGSFQNLPIKDRDYLEMPRIEWVPLHLITGRREVNVDLESSFWPEEPRILPKRWC